MHSNVESIPRISKNLKDLRCCDGDAITLECHVEGQPEPNVFWEKDGKIIHDKSEDYRQSFDGRIAKLAIKRTYPEDEGVYTIVVCNRMGRAKGSCCILVDGECCALLINDIISFRFYLVNDACCNFIAFSFTISPRGEGEPFESSIIASNCLPVDHINASFYARAQYIAQHVTTLSTNCVQQEQIV